jgi:glycosyltransferase involved in cell wall biosynthesis
MREWKSRAFRIMTMDNCWNGTAKQWLGVATSPIVVQRIADAAWVPGERQAVFAKKLGFTMNQILRGLYSCDHDLFARHYRHQLVNTASSSDSFLFVGRFVKEKGLTTLISAYRRYRDLTSQPWPLSCCGAGDLRNLLTDVPGVTIKGFVQPKDLPSQFAEAACLILPSTFEPWGLVVHEAAAAGLMILASDRVGSTPHLVQDGYNGFTFDAGDSFQLAALMYRISSSPLERRRSMAAASYSLSLQYTPRRWAETLLSFIEYHRSSNPY